MLELSKNQIRKSIPFFRELVLYTLLAELVWELWKIVPCITIVDIIALGFYLPTDREYKVKDISLAEWGRKEIRLAEAEMPG
jgi:hypothetical protein